MRRSTNSDVMKDKNKKLILDLIREKNLSRAEIAKITKLTKASVTIIVDGLISAGIVSEVGVESRGVGRRPTLLSIQKDAFFSIGVNITRSYVDIGLINLFGEIQWVKRLNNIGVDPDSMLQEVSDIIQNQTKKISPNQILGIGVSTPGPVDYKQGVVLNPPNFNHWHNHQTTKTLEELAGHKVYLENIANVLALSEKYYGNAKDVSNYMLVVADEGIGSGIIIENKIFRGINGFGNELGHTSIAFDGIPCECGNVGCLEKYASMPSILAGSGYQSWRQVMEHLERPDAKTLFNQEIEYLSTAIINAINLFDLQQIIVGGDIRYNSNELIRVLADRINQQIIMRHKRHISIMPQSDNNSGVIAAAISPIYAFYNEI